MNHLNRARKLAGLPLVEESPPTKPFTAILNEEAGNKVIKAAAEWVIDYASEAAWKKNGGVDVDGVRDHLDTALKEINILIKAYIKSNKMDEIKSDEK